MYNLELKPLRRHLWSTELDRMFDSLAKTDETFAPHCEILDGEKYFTISMDVPGLKKDEISLEIKDQKLHLTGERKFEKTEEQGQVLRSERRYGKFARVFTLPPNVNTEAIEARFENGVLEVIIPKEEKAQSRKIEILS